MRLYYLTSEHWAKVALERRRLKLSTIGELNDPFELLGVSIGDKRARNVIRYVYRRLSETYGLICMSKTWQSPVMWAHYGDKHKGVCLGFDVDDASVREVKYEPSRLTTLLGDNPKLSDVNIAGIETLMTTKYQDWAYEGEWRLIINFQRAIEDADGKHFFPFAKSAFTLREIILGHRCDWTMQGAVKAVGKPLSGVHIKRVRPSFQKFEMVRQQREKVIYVKAA